MLLTLHTIMPNRDYAVEINSDGVSDPHLPSHPLQGSGLFVSLVQNHEVWPTETGRAGPVQR